MMLSAILHQVPYHKISSCLNKTWNIHVWVSWTEGLSGITLWISLALAGHETTRTSRLQSAPLSISGSKAGEPALAPSLPAPCWCGSPGLHSLATFSYGQGVILQGCFPSLCCVGGEQSLVFGMQRRQLHRVGGYGGRFPLSVSALQWSLLEPDIL